jgi:hypothetical protein
MILTEHAIQQYRKRFNCKIYDREKIKKIIKEKLDDAKPFVYPRLYKKDEKAAYKINGRCIFVILNNRVVTVFNKVDMSHKKRKKINKKTKHYE